MATVFPANEKTYAVVLKNAVPANELAEIAQTIKRLDTDNIAIWSVAPFDITQQTDWPAVKSAFHAIARKQTVVEQVTQQHVDQSASTISVIAA